MNTEQRRAEAVTQAEQTAELLIGDLRSLHKSLCVDKPTVADHLAERAVLDLITAACDLRNSLAGIAPQETTAFQPSTFNLQPSAQ